MGVFRKLTLEEVKDILDLYGFDEPEKVLPLGEGISNSNFKVVTPTKKLLLKIAETQSLDGLRHEIQVMQYLDKHLYPFSVLPLKMKDGEEIFSHQDSHGVLYPFIDGHLPKINPFSMEQIGRALGSFHQISFEFGGQGEGLQQDYALGINSLSEFVNDPRCPEDFKEIFIQHFPEGLGPLKSEDLPSGLVHGDLFYDNTLFKGKKLEAILDFELAGKGYFIHDLGVAIAGSAVTKKENNLRVDHTLMQALIRGYESKRPLTRKERNLVKDSVYLGLFSISMWRVKKFKWGNLDQSKSDSYKELLDRLCHFSKMKPLAKSGKKEAAGATPLKNAYFASCPRGLEQILYNEVKAQKIQNVELSRGGVSFSGSNGCFIPLVLSTRVASRVYKKLFEFTIKDENDLYQKCLKLKWKNYLRNSQTLKVDTTIGRNSRFKNSLFLSQKIKDAIVDKIRKESGHRPSVNLRTPDILFRVHVEPGPQGREKVSISLDLIGFPLFHRGYKIKSHKAPLKENLAAGLVLSTKWNPESQVFVDGMCGSGSFVIEAALIAGDIPPTYKILEKLQDSSEPFYSFQKHDFFLKDPDLPEVFHHEIQKALKKTRQGFSKLKKNQIFAFDLDPGHVQITRDNLAHAGLGNIVQVSEGDVTKSSSPVEIKEGARAIFIANPPYGERMENEENLERLYRDMGENLKNNFKNYFAYILTGNLELRKVISLKTSSRQTFYNGPIECRLLEYDLF